MKLSKFKKLLNTNNMLTFSFMDGAKVPAHFHITEVGLLTRKFIDCG
jgi:hypothetical protein